MPRPGVTNSTWPDDQVLVKIQNHSYTAYDIPQLLADLGFAHRVAAYKAVLAGPDLGSLGHPGVNTFVTYGYNLSTSDYFEYARDFIPVSELVPGQPSKVSYAAEMGDGYVPVRSALRGWYQWQEPMSKAGYRLLYKGYANQFHGNCSGSDECTNDWFNLIQDGTIPHGAWSNM
eukprot:TRINITY_DN10240_c0_g1_i3.p1 TRINITY_DN10240_c0_g1~~TRINITY_DN10240_c0_g1_i3.p1  ORF type:complete len:174 (+),score=27.59 TRINITY_DN10240_c0_g1_i3:227-748(+)